MFCHGRVQLVLCQGHSEGTQSAGAGGELSLIEFFSFKHPSPMAGADLSGGFCGHAAVPALTELIWGKRTLQSVAKSAPCNSCLCSGSQCPGARDGAVSQVLGKGGSCLVEIGGV